MRYYTKTGDSGETSLYTGERVPKNSLRVEAYGTVDELQAFMGFARSLANDQEIDDDIKTVESMLVNVMAQLASTDGAIRVTEDDVIGVEALCDKYTERLEARSFSFVLPGESAASSALHMARTVARRAERSVLNYAATESVDAALLKYLNRISDLLYAMASYIDL